MKWHLEPRVLAIRQLGPKRLDRILFHEGRRRGELLEAVAGRPGRWRVFKIVRALVQAGFATLAPARADDEEYGGDDEGGAEAEADRESSDEAHARARIRRVVCCAAGSCRGAGGGRDDGYLLFGWISMEKRSLRGKSRR